MTQSGPFGAHFGGHLFVGLGLLAILPLTARAELHPYGFTEIRGRSEPISIWDAAHGWEGDYEAGETQYLSGWFEAGLRGEEWGLGGLYRRDYALWFTPDSAELIGAIGNDRTLPIGRRYEVAVEAHALVAKGLRLSWQRQWQPSLNTGLGLALLEADYMLDGSIKGTATATGSKNYVYSAWADYAYTEDLLFERDVEGNRGYGVTLDAQVEWALSPDWRLDLRARDLPGFVWWQDLPYTQARAESDRTQTDESGFRRWDPLVSGFEGNHGRYRQTLPLRLQGDLYYGGWPVTVAAGVQHQFDDDLVRLGAGWQADDWSLLGWYWLEDGAFELAAHWQNWQLGLGIDSLDWQQARFATLSLGYRY